MDYQQLTTYEQPANEVVRICLRFEFLHQQAHFFLHGNSAWESRACMAAMMDLLLLVDRPDLRTKLSQEVSRITNSMNRLQLSPNIDSTRLYRILNELDTMSGSLQQNKGKFADILRNNEFVKALAQVDTNPGGTCPYNTPGFSLWLDMPAQKRQQQLASWLDEFAELQALTESLLRLIRQSATPERYVAAAGFYQSPSSDPQTPTQIIRVQLANSENVFPRISAGRHGLSIRFYDQTLTERPSQTRRDVEFYLACCIL